MKNLTVENKSSFEIPVVDGVVGGVETLVVDAKSLHKALESGRHFSNWIASKIKSLDLIQGEDYEMSIAGLQSVGYNKFVAPTYSSNIPHNAEKIYSLTMDAAKHVCMAEGTHRGKSVRTYFIETERKYLASLRTPALPAPVSIETALAAALSDGDGALHLIRTLADRLIEQNDAIKQKNAQIIQAQAIIEEQAPKAEFVDKLLVSDITYGIQEVSRMLAMAPNQLGQMLRDGGYIFKNKSGGRNKAYSQYSESGKGFFIERLTVQGFPELRMTPKGLAFFRELYAQHALALPTPVQPALPSPDHYDFGDLFGSPH